MTDTSTIRGPQLARNSLLNLGAFGVPLVVAAACMPPIVVRGMDTQRFGLLTLAWTILNYFGVFDLGLGRAATKFVAEALSGAASVTGSARAGRQRGSSSGHLGRSRGSAPGSRRTGCGDAAVPRSRRFGPGSNVVSGGWRCRCPWSWSPARSSARFEAASGFDRTSAIRLPAGSRHVPRAAHRRAAALEPADDRGASCRDSHRDAGGTVARMPGEFPRSAPPRRERAMNCAG
jgi:hypothetical protein